MHGLDDLGCRDRPCARETLQKQCQAKEMIAVPVGDVNRGEVLAARDDPIQQSLRLLRREKGVHENGVALTADECRRIRHPHQFFLAGWQIANEARALYREYIPLKTSFRSVDCIHRRVLFWLSEIRNIGVGLGGAPWIATWVPRLAPGLSRCSLNHSVADLSGINFGPALKK